MTVRFRRDRESTALGGREPMKPGPKKTCDTQFHLTLPAGELERWRRVAEVYGMPLAAWVKMVCGQRADLPTPVTDKFLAGRR